MGQQQLDIHRSQTAYRFTEPSRTNTFAVICAIVLLLVYSFNTVRESEHALDVNVASKLKTVLRIESEAVRQWQRSQTQFVTYLATDPQISELVATEKNGGFEAKNDDVLTDFKNRLDGKRFLIMSMGGVVVAKSGDRWEDIHPDIFLGNCCAAYSKGLASHSEILPAAGQGSDDQEFWWFTTSPITHPELGIVGLLAIAHDLSNELTEVLSSSRSGRTGEVVAVTGKGQLVSESRFGNYSGDLSFYQDVHHNHVATKSSQTVVNLNGEVDQRGVDVATASRWLPDMGFGLVAKMDVSESGAPVAQLRSFVWTLFGLLLLTTVSTLVYRCYLYRLRQLAKAAELNKKQLGSYVLDEKIGEGAMGVVYKANHALLKRPTAVKMLPLEKSSPDAVSRFEREVQISSKLKHPNTIAIYDYGRTDSGLFYYAMEFLDGLNLEQLVHREGGISDGRVISILKQIGESLREAHEMGLVHRDIKPANIMLCNRGGAVDTVKVLDFGMVREVAYQDERKPATLSGTPNYMAPELFRNVDNADFRADIYAVGAVGFFLLTGEPLIKAQSLDELIKLHESNIGRYARTRIARYLQISGRDISPVLINLICGCLKNPVDQRIGSVGLFLDELERCRPKTKWDSQAAFNWWEALKSEKVESSNSSGNIRQTFEPSLDATQSFVSNRRISTLANDRFVEC